MSALQIVEVIFLSFHTLVELSVGVLMYVGRWMPSPYTQAFTDAHAVVRGFAGGGAAATGVIGVLTIAELIERPVGLAFCGGYQLFIAINESVHERLFFTQDEKKQMVQHILFGIMPHVLLGIWGVVLAIVSANS